MSDNREYIEEIDDLNKLTSSELDQIKRRSVYGLPDSPSANGKTATEIKRAMYNFVLDRDSDLPSIIKKIDAIIEYTNTIKEALLNNTEVSKESINSITTDKLDKVSTTTTYPQTYTKGTNGTQTMLDVTPNNVPWSIPSRDIDGRFKAANPSASSDVATKDYVDTADSGKLDKVTTVTTNRQIYTKVADGTQAMVDLLPTNVAWTIPWRDGNGRFKCGTPSANDDVANKGYVDGKINNLVNGTTTVGKATYATKYKDDNNADVNINSKIKELVALIDSIASGDIASIDNLLTQIQNQLNNLEDDFDDFMTGTSADNVINTLIELRTALTTLETSISNVSAQIPTKVSDLILDEGVIEISSQNVLITDLDTGVYKLTYGEGKRILYNGKTNNTDYLAINPLTILVVNKFLTSNSTNYWDWYFIGGNVEEQQDQSLYYGFTSETSGEYHDKRLVDLFTYKNFSSVGNVKFLPFTDNGEIKVKANVEIHPVGSVYMSINSTSPASLFGGTWEQLKDRFLLGAGDTYTNGATGGEETHTLTVNEMPNHIHNINGLNAESGIPTPTGGEWEPLYVRTDANVIRNTADTGGSQAHNNMPPYLVVYMWKRTA